MFILIYTVLDESVRFAKSKGGLSSYTVQVAELTYNMERGLSSDICCREQKKDL
jgi:hypothetical protein